MEDDRFEWDDVKADRNRRHHGVTFELAREAFNDAFAIEAVDRRQDTAEERFILLGMVDSRVLFVAYTMRGARVRIISARKAQANERRMYHDDNRGT